MFQKPLPEEYQKADAAELHQRIIDAKTKLGNKLLILGHHYQRDEIIEHADLRGDSYKLAKEASQVDTAEYIVFCGVHFMAESADILSQDHQKVILPNMAAGCSMADMANHFQVKNAWKALKEHIKEPIIPVTYINSAANIKAFVGEHGGIVCTSTNAKQVLEWALNQGNKVMFLPDQHLGRNTAVKMGYDPTTDMCVWNPFKPLGDNTVDTLLQSKFILWKGHCSVHKRFTVEQIQNLRAQHPKINILVHPECELSVVEASDYDGSTEFIINTVQAAPANSIWGVGTEINLVSRLAKENTDKTIMCLDPQICPCSTMYRIHPSFLCWVLENLAAGNVVNQVKVGSDIAHWSKVALQRMLDLKL